MIDAYDPSQFEENLKRIISNSGYFKNVNFYSSYVPDNPKYPLFVINQRGIITSSKFGETQDTIQLFITFSYAEESGVGKSNERFMALHELFRTNNNLNYENGKPSCSNIASIEFQQFSSQEALKFQTTVQGFVLIVSINITLAYTVMP